MKKKWRENKKILKKYPTFPMWWIESTKEKMFESIIYRKKKRNPLTRYKNFTKE